MVFLFSNHLCSSVSIRGSRMKPESDVSAFEQIARGPEVVPAGDHGECDGDAEADRHKPCVFSPWCGEDVEGFEP